MSYGPRECFGCKILTDRYDHRHHRYACEVCYPEDTLSEEMLKMLTQGGPSNSPFDYRLHIPPEERKLPGETRQEWRRRMREKSRN